ncbi:MAG: hypothetical protein ACE5R4_13765 [Armatimonadota bacterium]
MDIFEVIDELERLGDKGDRWWRVYSLPGETVIPAEEFFDLTDKIRASIPQEVSTADQITRERDSILAEAHEERNKIINAAKEQAALLVSNDRVVQEAQERAEQILRQAQVEAQSIRDDANTWAREVMGRLEDYTGRVLATVQKSRRLMDERMRTEAQAGEE